MILLVSCPRLYSNNSDNNGSFCSALPMKTLTAQGAYKSDTNNIIIITHTHTHVCTHACTHTYTHTHTQRTCYQNTHIKRLKIKPSELHLHSLCLFLSLCLCLSVCLCLSLSLPIIPISLLACIQVQVTCYQSPTGDILYESLQPGQQRQTTAPCEERRTPRNDITASH